MQGYRKPGVANAIGDFRPAVIGPGAQNVYFIATARAVLVSPELSSLRMQGHALNIAVSPGEKSIIYAWVIKPRVAGSRFAIQCNAMNAAGIVPGVLSAIHLTAVTNGYVEVAGCVECHAPTKVAGRIGARERFEDGADIFQALSFKNPAGYASSHSLAGAMCIAEEECFVVCKLRVQNHI